MYQFSEFRYCASLARVSWPPEFSPGSGVFCRPNTAEASLRAGHLGVLIYPDAYLSKTTNPRLTHTASDPDRQQIQQRHGEHPVQGRT